MKQILSLTTLLSMLFSMSCSSDIQNSNVAPTEVAVMTVQRDNVEVYKEFPATVEGKTEVEIRPQVSGILEKIFVDEGAFVQAGQSLFRINDRTYKEQYNKANAELLAAKAAAANAELEVSKIRPLVQSKVVSELQLQTAQSNFDMALARVRQADALLADANISLGYTLIKSPAYGYIGRLNKKAGSLLSVNDIQELTTLTDINEVHVYFSVSEQDFSSLKNELPGSSIEDKLKRVKKIAFAPAGGDVYREAGKLDIVNGAFNKNSGAISIRASFSNKNGLLRSGNTGRITLTMTKNNIISIPQAATTSIQDKVFVFTVDDSSKVRKQLIGVAGRSGNNFLVREGLKNGDRIVVAGIETLQDGMKVTAAAAKPQDVVKLQ